METEQLKLDGNAVGGLLREVFEAEMTSVLATCAACGAVAVFGAVDVYVRAPGVVLRCRSCGGVLGCIVTRSGVHCVSLLGIADFPQGRGA